MSSKTIVYLGMFIGSIIGGYLPVLWGGSLFSFSSVLTSAAGSLVGIFIKKKTTASRR